jgi:hypothetical protein
MTGEKKMSPEDFHSAVLQSIDEGLMALGESVRQVVYHYVERMKANLMLCQTYWESDLLTVSSRRRAGVRGLC